MLIRRDRVSAGAPASFECAESGAAPGLAPFAPLTPFAPLSPLVPLTPFAPAGAFLSRGSGGRLGMDGGSKLRQRSRIRGKHRFARGRTPFHARAGAVWGMRRTSTVTTLEGVRRPRLDSREPSANSNDVAGCIACESIA